MRENFKLSVDAARKVWLDQLKDTPTTSGQLKICGKRDPLGAACEAFKKSEPGFSKRLQPVEAVNYRFAMLKQDVPFDGYCQDGDKNKTYVSYLPPIVQRWLGTNAAGLFHDKKSNRYGMWTVTLLADHNNLNNEQISRVLRDVEFAGKPSPDELPADYFDDWDSHPDYRCLKPSVN